MTRFDVIAFDADDTLWHNESLFTITQERFREMLLPYHDATWIDQRLHETEIRNLSLFGYGIKGFTLSMIETALELTENRIGGETIAELIEAGKEMLRAPVEPLPGVVDVLERLGETYQLMVITKGDLFHQESKVAGSGFDSLFRHVEIVSEKEPEVYRGILARHGLEPDRFLMVGNSLRSDVLPIIEIGGHAVHIPYETTWAHEQVDLDPRAEHGFHTLGSIDELPDLIARLDQV